MFAGLHYELCLQRGMSLPSKLCHVIAGAIFSCPYHDELVKPPVHGPRVQQRLALPSTGYESSVGAYGREASAGELYTNELEKFRMETMVDIAVPKLVSGKYLVNPPYQYPQRTKHGIGTDNQFPNLNLPVNSPSKFPLPFPQSCQTRC